VIPIDHAGFQSTVTRFIRHADEHFEQMHGSVQIARPLFHLHDFSIEALALEIRDL